MSTASQALLSKGLVDLFYVKDRGLQLLFFSS